MANTDDAPPGVNTLMSHHLAEVKAGALSTSAMITTAIMTDSALLAVAPAAPATSMDRTSAGNGTDSEDIASTAAETEPGPSSHPAAQR